MLAWGFPARQGPRRMAGIVSARNEATSVAGVVRELFGAGVTEVLAVVNGAIDATAEMASRAGARVLQFAEPLGHDVGRAVGAAAADADILLFVDADFVIPRADLAPFLQAVAKGVDLALNDLSFLYRRYPPSDFVSIGKFFLNRALGRVDLGSASLTAVPHALSRRALETIGAKDLAVPPLAQARAILAGLRVEAVHAVDVYSRNRIRPGLNIGGGEESVESLIVGDHLEALAYLIRERGPRAGLTDLARRRELL